MTASLPDVNVFLALVAEGHLDHTKALQWFDRREPESLVVRRITQMCLLRLPIPTNPKVMTSGAFSMERTWEVSRDLVADRRVLFEYEPPDQEDGWRKLTEHPSVGPSSWTDGYLAAFAKLYDYEMVMFDGGFRRWTELRVRLLGDG